MRLVFQTDFHSSSDRKKLFERNLRDLKTQTFKSVKCSEMQCERNPCVGGDLIPILWSDANAKYLHSPNDMGHDAVHKLFL